jgi:hypothetical protein
MRWAAREARTAEKRNAYKIKVGETEGKRLFERPRRRLEDNVNIDTKQIICEGVY